VPTTDLGKKLLIKSGHTVLLVQAPGDFRLATKGADVATRGKGPFDAVLLFAENQKALGKHLPKAMQALAEDGVFWIAYPKTTSGVPTDLTRDKGWAAAEEAGLEGVSQVAIDATWSALRFRPAGARPAKKARTAMTRATEPPKELLAAVAKSAAAKKTWATLAPSHVREYAGWIEDAKRPETRAKRIASAVEMLAKGQRDRNEKYR
jgi:hypothetical protein